MDPYEGGIIASEKPTTYTGAARVSVLTLAFDTVVTADRGVRRGKGQTSSPSTNRTIIIF